jgi:hypothetical protein
MQALAVGSSEMDSVDEPTDESCAMGQRLAVDYAGFSRSAKISPLERPTASIVISRVINHKYGTSEFIGVGTTLIIKFAKLSSQSARILAHILKILL